MKILCMEDQEDKYQHIKKVLNLCPAIELVWKENCQDGLMELLKDKYDYLLLDMSMPLANQNYKKDSYDSYAGEAVLKEIKRKRYNIKVIIITGFNDFVKENKVITLAELVEELEKNYREYYIGHIKYDSTSIEWQNNLMIMLGEK